MKDNKNEEQKLKRRIAANLIYYRKLNNMTQTELAERINYSDSVSNGKSIACRIFSCYRC